MEGHIRKRGGKWAIVFDVGDQPARQCATCGGKRYWEQDVQRPPEKCSKCGEPMRRITARRQVWRSGFATKREAQDARTLALAEIQSGIFVAPSKLTLGDYLVDIWLPSRKPSGTQTGRSRGRVSIGTWDGYRIYVEKYVIPNLGGMLLADLKPHHLEALYDRLERQGGRSGRGLSLKTLANLHGIIHKALSDAVRRGLVGRNVADAVESPRGRRREQRVWSPEELRMFLLHVADDRLYAAWLLFATTGMRRGEVAGLAWEDIDLDAARLTVRWTLGVVDNKVIWKDQPKTRAGARTMALDPTTVEALRRYRARQAEERLAFGPAWTENNTDHRGVGRSRLVFTWEDGRMLNPERLSRWFVQHSEDAELPRIRLHDVRHTYASAALASAEGWHDVKIISERLGHASVGITLDTYSHVLPAADERAATTLARVILGVAET